MVDAFLSVVVCGPKRSPKIWMISRLWYGKGAHIEIQLQAGDVVRLEKIQSNSLWMVKLSPRTPQETPWEKLREKPPLVPGQLWPRSSVSLLHGL